MNSELENERNEGGVFLCWSCRRTQVCRLGVTTERLGDDGRVYFEAMCPPFYEGGPGVAAGGWTAEVMDETIGRVPMAYKQTTVTGTLNVRYVKPVPIEHPLQATAWVDRIEGRKWFVSGELVLASSSAVLATASAIMIAREKDSHFREFQNWMGQQGANGARET